jgi:uncharacterized protein YbbK (DUF523 family)
MPPVGKPAKPRVGVSKCLGFAPCRYDGTVIDDRFVESLKRRVAFCPVCPEMEIGLGCPRSPVRIVLVRGRRRLVQPSTGRDLTAAMQRFVRGFLDSVGPLDGFILKSRSPSCGIGDARIFASPGDKSPVRSGSGFFAAAVLRAFRGVPVADERALADPATREEFLAKLFAPRQGSLV